MNPSLNLTFFLEWTGHGTPRYQTWQLCLRTRLHGRFIAPHWLGARFRQRNLGRHFFKYLYSPPVRWGLLDCIRAVWPAAAAASAASYFSAWSSSAVCCNGQRRISTASCRSQWAAPGLNRELKITAGSVGSAGPHQPEKRCQKIGQERVSKNMSEWMSEKNVVKCVGEECQKICQKEFQKKC